ncbi:acid phosphatase [Malassezia pachydermatis]
MHGPYPMLHAALYLVPWALLVLPSLADPITSWNNVTGNANVTFPTAVGNTGDVAPGALPFKVQVDKLNSTTFQKVYAPEMRWLPRDAEKDNATSDDIFANLGAYTPWRPADGLFPETEAYKPLPDQCTMKQVHLLVRHGARYPTDGMDEGPGTIGALVLNSTRNNTFSAKGNMAFLNTWNYSLGQAVLVHQGAQELFDAGVKHYYDYARLLQNVSSKPVIRTTSSSRVLDSARYWTLGFFGWDADQKMNLEVISEADKYNNTLEPKYACPNGKAFAFGDKMRQEWQKVYLKDALARIQNDTSGVTWTISDMANMIQLCPYETVGMGYSNFCSIFTKSEWEGYEYDMDLKFQGNSGFMNPTSKAMGMGYVQDFLARVTKHALQVPSAEQNKTLERNTTYFPLDQPLYADFSHDTVMVNILTSFNITQLADQMNSTSPDPTRRFRASHIVPFGSRFAFEIMECDKGEQYIRVKINEAIVPLNEGQGCEPRVDGLCKLQDFVSHLQKAMSSIPFALTCYGKNGTDIAVTHTVEHGMLTPEQILSNNTSSRT